MTVNRDEIRETLGRGLFEIGLLRSRGIHREDPIPFDRQWEDALDESRRELWRLDGDCIRPVVERLIEQATATRLAATANALRLTQSELDLTRTAEATLRRRATAAETRLAVVEGLIERWTDDRDDLYPTVNPSHAVIRDVLTGCIRDLRAALAGGTS